MTEKTLSILGVIKKKLDSLDRGKKTKTVDNSLDNEFDYVVPAKKNSSNDASSDTNNSNSQDISSANSNTSDTKNGSLNDKELTSTHNTKSNDILANPELDIDKEDGFKNPLKSDNPSKEQYDFDIEDLIEEYEDQVGDEDLDGGSFSSITYNLKIENKEGGANSVSSDLQFSKTTTDLDFDKINLNFSDQLSVSNDKLFGSTKTKSDQGESLSTSLLSKLTDQFKSKQSSETTQSKATLNQELKLDFDLKIDIDEMPNIVQQQNSSDKILESKIEIENKVIIEENNNQIINEEKKVVKDEIDLEFEKQLLQLPTLDHHTSSVISEINTTHENSQSRVTPKENITPTRQEDYHHFNLPDDSELSELELAEAKMFSNNAQPNPNIDDLAKPAIDLPPYNQQPQVIAEHNSMDKMELPSQVIAEHNSMDKMELPSQVIAEHNSMDKMELPSQVIAEHNSMDKMELPSQVIAEHNSMDKIDEVKKEILKEQAKPIENNSQNLLNSAEYFTNYEIKSDESPNITNKTQFTQNSTSQSLKLDFDLSNFTANVSEKVSKTILNDDVVIKTNSSIQKLIETKNMMAGINNFMQSPYPAQIALQLMEPKLEKWLNDNLPNLVEKIVSEEIKKIIPREIK